MIQLIMQKVSKMQPVVVGLAPIAVPPGPNEVKPLCAPGFSLAAVVARPLEVPGGRRPWLVRRAA